MESEGEIRMKLLVDTKENRVLYAEAEKDFVDFIQSLLGLSVSSIIELLNRKKDDILGCMGNLYESMENMGKTPCAVDKESMLKPLDVKYYGCNNSYDSFHCYITTEFGSKCPVCDYPMRILMNNVSKSVGKIESEMVKEGEKYVVTDDLEVMPMSTDSYVSVLEKFKVKDLGSLVVKHVRFGKEEGLELLASSLCSEKALTGAFLRNMAEKESERLVDIPDNSKICASEGYEDEDDDEDYNEEDEDEDEDEDEEDNDDLVEVKLDKDELGLEPNPQTREYELEEEEEEEEEEVDETGWELRDIEVVMSLSGASRETAVMALEANEGDVIRACRYCECWVDETGLLNRDIRLVMSQSGASRASAVTTLNAQRGDIVSAIIELTQ